MDVADDPRFHAALAHFEAGDWLEATDAFEELFFEAVRDEVEFVRVFLQVATGMHHIARGSVHAAAERLGEGVRAIDRVQNARGFALDLLRADVRVIERLRARDREVGNARLRVRAVR